jgi:mRNA interferase MazF
MVRGEIYLANLDPGSGSEQRGTRPVLVVSRDALNEHAPIVIVVPITGREHKRQLYPTHSEIKAGEGGLTKDSVLLCEQIRAISKSRLTKRVGKVPAEVLQKTETALRIAMDL